MIDIWSFDQIFGHWLFSRFSCWSYFFFGSFCWFWSCFFLRSRSFSWFCNCFSSIFRLTFCLTWLNFSILRRSSSFCFFNCCCYICWQFIQRMSLCYCSFCLSRSFCFSCLNHASTKDTGTNHNRSCTNRKFTNTIMTPFLKKMFSHFFLFPFIRSQS